MKKNIFENKLQKVVGTGLFRDSKTTLTIQGTSNSPLKGVLDNCTPAGTSKKGGTGPISVECGGIGQNAAKKRALRALEKWSCLGEKPQDSSSGGRT